MPGDPNQNSNNIGGLYNPGARGQEVMPGDQSRLNPYAPVDSGGGYYQSFNPANTTNGDQTGGKMPAAGAQTYGDIFNQAQGQSGYFNQLASRYNQNAPTIGDVSQLGIAQKYYQDLMNGDGGYAQNQFRQSQDQSIAAQMAMANSARGGAAERAGAQRAAMQGAGQQMAGGANQAAQIAMQEEQQGAQGMANIGQLQLQRQSANAQLQQANQAQINQMMTSLYGMGEQEQGLGLSAQQAYMANLLAAEGINTQQSQFNTQLGMQGVSAGLQAGGALIGAASSDANLKTDITPQGRGGIGSIDYSQANMAKPQAPISQPSVGASAGMGAVSGAATGAAAGGPVGAVLGGAGGALSGGLNAQQKQDPNDKLLKAGSTAASAGMGAASGAAMGSALGPIGTGVGAVAGGIAGLLKGLL